MKDDNGMKYTKEYIAKVRLCSNLIDPPASDVIGELLDEIEQLTAERDELKLAVAQTELDISAWKNICAEWRKDAERLATILDNLFMGCILCNGKKKNSHFTHEPDCPITLHRELGAKYGGENNQGNVYVV